MSLEFQSTRPRGARPAVTLTRMTPTPFQSTRPRGARPLTEASHSNIVRFNPRARVGRDRQHFKRFDARIASFNPRARVGRDSNQAQVDKYLTLFQSTRPRGARPREIWYGFRWAQVSIHAPAWGATRQRRAVIRDQAVSIHAPAWGATAGRGHWPTCSSRFNPRARVGRDSEPMHCAKATTVSIHAPAWGATFSALRRGSRRTVSIHAPAWGATRSITRSSQSRRSFNPRARVGRDCVHIKSRSCNL